MLREGKGLIYNQRINRCILRSKIRAWKKCVQLNRKSRSVVRVAQFRFKRRFAKGAAQLFVRLLLSSFFPILTYKVRSQGGDSRIRRIWLLQKREKKRERERDLVSRHHRNDTLLGRHIDSQVQRVSQLPYTVCLLTNETAKNRSILDRNRAFAQRVCSPLSGQKIDTLNYPLTHMQRQYPP